MGLVAILLFGLGVYVLRRASKSRVAFLGCGLIGASLGGIAAGGILQGAPSIAQASSFAIVLGGIGLVLGGAIDLVKYFRSQRTTDTQSDEYIAPLSSVAPPSSASADRELTSAFCTECGKTISSQAKFCSSCGTAVPAGSAAYSAPIPKIKGKATAPEPADTNAPDPEFSEPSPPNTTSQ